MGESLDMSSGVTNACVYTYMCPYTLSQGHVLPGSALSDLFLCALSHIVHTLPTTTIHMYLLPPPHPSLASSVTPSHPLSFRWQAGNHSAFWGMTLDEGIRYRLGTMRPSSSVANMNEIRVSPSLPTRHLFIPCSSKGLVLSPTKRLCVTGQVTPLHWAFA